jgi:hypothetical protein
MTRLGSDRLVVQERLHDGRLLALTAALLCAPLVVGASAALGRGTDTVLLVTSLLVMVPLVMARIRGLVQEREAAQAALAHQATHDALTGLLNAPSSSPASTPPVSGSRWACPPGCA